VRFSSQAWDLICDPLEILDRRRSQSFDGMKPRDFLTAVLLAITVSGSGLGLGPLPVAHAGTGPIAAFTYNPCVQCAVPGDLVFFNGNYSLSLGGQIVSYTWNFGDGAPLLKTTSPLTNHDYFGSPSHWLVTLTVQDSYGMIDSISQQVIFDVVLQFSFHPLKPFAGEPVNFNATANVYASATTGPVFGWSFGDGTSATGALVVHVYQKPAVYRVELAANTSLGNASISKTVIVRPGIVVISKCFDGINVTVFASLIFNSTSHTVSGTLSVTAINGTSGMIIFQKTFNVTLAYGEDQSARLILATPGSVSMLGVTVVLKESGAVTASLTRDPDVTRQGSVNIVDAATIALDFGTSSSSPNWHAASDLDGDEQVDILDAATIGLDYGLPVFQ